MTEAENKHTVAERQGEKMARTQVAQKIYLPTPEQMAKKKIQGMVSAELYDKAEKLKGKLKWVDLLESLLKAFVEGAIK